MPISIHLHLKAGPSTLPVENLTPSRYLQSHRETHDLSTFLEINGCATLTIRDGRREWYSTSEEAGPGVVENWLAAFYWHATVGPPVDVWETDQPILSIHATGSSLRLRRLGALRIWPTSRLVAPLRPFLQQLVNIARSLSDLCAGIRSELGAEPPETLEAALWARNLYDNASLTSEEQDQVTDLQIERFANATDWPSPSGPLLVPADQPAPPIPLSPEKRNQLLLASLPPDLEPLLTAVRQCYPALRPPS